MLVALLTHAAPADRAVSALGTILHFSPAEVAKVAAATRGGSAAAGGWWPLSGRR